MFSPFLIGRVVIPLVNDSKYILIDFKAPLNANQIWKWFMPWILNDSLFILQVFMYILSSILEGLTALGEEVLFVVTEVRVVHPVFTCTD